MCDRKGKNSSFKNRASLKEAMLNQKAVQGNSSLAAELAEKVELMEIKTGDVLIEQGADDHDVYFIVGGRFEIVFHGRTIAAKGPGEHVGEMAAILPSLRRSATVRATEPGLVARLGATELLELGKRHEALWKGLA